MKNRPGVIKLIALGKGQKLVWDVTCVDMLAENYLARTSVTGAGAELACKVNMGIKKKN